MSAPTRSWIRSPLRALRQHLAARSAVTPTEDSAIHSYFRHKATQQGYTLSHGQQQVIAAAKEGTEAVGNRTRVKVVKNKMAPPFKQAEFDILYGVGISREGSLIDFGVEHAIVKKSGSWYTYDGDQLGQGKENSRNFLLENPAIAAEIGAMRATEQIDIADLGKRNPNLDVAEVKDELALASEACKPFELAAFREGHLTPVYFGSALRNFGVGDLLEGLGKFAPAPRAQDSDLRKVEAAEPRMSAFVFKIQANMDPNHRDRIAFARLCSGKLSRGMKAKLVRTGKNMSLSSPQFFFAQDRSVADEAFAGDVVGIPNHGTLRIGDTLTEGEDLTFVGVPSFAPEIVRRVRLTDAMKAKKLKEALQQMSEEGVVQVFRPRDGAPALVGVVGPLQLDVLKARLDAEYSLPVEFEVSEFSLARWISSDDRKALDAFISANNSGIADDVDGDPVFMAKNEFYLGYTRERAEGITFSNVKDVKKKA